MSDKAYRYSIYRASVVQLDKLIEDSPQEIRSQFHASICYHVYDQQQDVITWPRVKALKSPDKDYSSIVSMMDCLVKFHEEEAWSYILRARALWGIEHYAAAFQDLHKALTIDSNNYTAKVLFCYTLIFLLKLPEAEVYAQKLLHEYGDQYSTYLMIHFLYEKQGIEENNIAMRVAHFKESLSILRKAKLLYPSHKIKLQQHEERLLERLDTCMDNP